MRMHLGYSGIMSMVLLGIALGSTALRAGDPDVVIPKPPDGWWKYVRAGDEAQYHMTTDGMVILYRMSIMKVEGPKITVNTRGFVKGLMMLDRTETIDATDPREYKSPAGSKAKKVGTEKKKLGEITFDCDVFEVEATQLEAKSKAWFSPKLPPIFKPVRAETTFHGKPMTMELVKFKGTLME